MKRVVISDLHIGSWNSREKELIDFLQTVECDELILAGDIIDFIKVPTFTKRSAELFKIIDNFPHKVVYVIGNHDISFRGLVGKSVFGVYFTRRYDFKDGKRKYRIIHGDQYEKGIIHWKYVINMLSIAQDFIERLFSFDLASFFHDKMFRKRKLRNLSDIIQWNEDVDVLIMGHNHTPEALIWVNEESKIKTYVNCGDWVEHSSYVTIEDDVIRLKSWANESRESKT